jgi:RNA polymerase sigma-70 factor (ECF subfamily)
MKLSGTGFRACAIVPSSNARARRNELIDTALEFQPETYRRYLLVLARVQLARAGPVRNKLEASDIVQETLLQAHVARDQFRGQTPEEFAGWLRRILANKLVDAERRFGRKKRDAVLEASYRETIDDSADRIVRIPARPQSSPSQHLLRHERELRLIEALDALPEDQRTAVELRYLGELSLTEISAVMERSKPSVAGLLRRGLAALRGELASFDL